MEELKPCPFCGGEAVMKAWESCLSSTGELEGVVVGCQQSACHGYADPESNTSYINSEHAARAWNNRTWGI